MGIFSKSNQCVGKIAEDNKKMRKALDWSYQKENDMINSMNTAALLIDNFLDGGNDKDMLVGALEALREHATVRIDLKK